MKTDEHRRGGTWCRDVLCAMLAAVTLASCTYYQTVPAQGRPGVFDRTWSAALGAAGDVGVDIYSSDRTTGIIQGTRGTDDVTIRVFTQADGSVRIEFNVRGPAGSDAVLADRLSRAYDQRMGR